METAQSAVTLPRTALEDRLKAACSGLPDKLRLRREELFDERRGGERSL